MHIDVSSLTLTYLTEKKVILTRDCDKYVVFHSIGVTFISIDVERKVSLIVAVT